MPNTNPPGEAREALEEARLALIVMLDEIRRQENSIATQVGEKYFSIVLRVLTTQADEIERLTKIVESQEVEPCDRCLWDGPCATCCIPDFLTKATT